MYGPHPNVANYYRNDKFSAVKKMSDLKTSHPTMSNRHLDHLLGKRQI